jgi:SAM-dependent methyltransferase
VESTGERQVAPTLDGIRRDHLARYEFAAGLLPRASLVLDCACGIGYGSKILADAGHQVVGVDKSEEAIQYGRQHYWHPSVDLIVGDAGQPIKSGADAAVCFETIEHIDDPLSALKAFHAAAPLLIASVPNEERFKYRRQKFHKRHYTRQEFLELLEAAGWRVTGWYGQADVYSEVVPNLNGRTAIVTAERAREGLASVPVPLETAPHHVAIVGLGPSCASFFELTRRMGGVSAYCDEVWGINAIGDVLRCDRVFHMDDLKVQEARARLRPGSNIDAMVKWLKTHPGPVYTSRVRPGYPGLVEFPIEDVLNAKLDTNGGVPYFNSTTAYAVAYAIYIGVKHISLWGIDYTLPNAHSAESGRACVEFWLGIAAARGIEISVPAETSLLDACANERDLLYGYDCVDWRIVQDGGGIRLEFTELEGEVDAEEIERRYDHKKHPNKLMQEQGK